MNNINSKEERQVRIFLHSCLRLYPVSVFCDVQESILAQLDWQQRELNSSERYKEFLEQKRLEKIAEQVAEQERKKAEKNSRPEGMSSLQAGKKKNKKNTRNKNIMKAMNLRVEFGDDNMMFRVPWDYSMSDLLADCCSVWRLDPKRHVLEDGFLNVWPSDSIVTSEVKPKVGVQDDFDESPKLVVVDKEVALSMFDRETAEEKAAKRAASMVSDVFIGPVPETLVEKSIRERFDLAKELGPYLFFIFVFIGCIFMKRNVYSSFVMTNAVQEYFMGESFPSEYKPNVNFCFTDIANSEEMYQWMTGVFLGGIMDGAPGRLLRYFRVVGGIQVRTIKMKQGVACEVPSAYGNALNSFDCYAPYQTTSEYEDKAPYSSLDYRTDHLTPLAPNQTTPQGVKPTFPWNQHGQLPFRYYWNENHVNTVPVTSSANRNVYGPNGFYTNLPLDEDYVTAAIKEYEATGFTDGGTRAVIVTVLLFNQNYNLFDHVRFLFEFDPGGVVTPTMYQTSFRMDTYGEPTWVSRFIFDFLYVWFIMLLYKNIVVKIHLTYLKTSSYLVYFYNTFNFLDFCIAAVSTTYIVLEAMNAFNPEKRKFDIATDSYVELGAIATAYELGTQLNAFNAFLVVLRTFEYLSISEPVQHLLRTLGLAAPECVSFSIMFLIIFYSFVIMANIIFGFIDEAFSNMSDSSITLLMMQLGEFDYPALVAANPFYAPIFFILYNIVIVFVLLNVFVGIIADAYEAAKHIDNDMNKDYLPQAGTLADDASIMYNGILRGIAEIFEPPKIKRNLVEEARIAEEERLAKEEEEREAREEEERIKLLLEKEAAAQSG